MSDNDRPNAPASVEHAESSGVEELPWNERPVRLQDKLLGVGIGLSVALLVIVLAYWRFG